MEWAGVFPRVFDSRPEGVLLVGVDTILLHANPAAVRLIGASSPEELTGRSICEFTGEDPRAVEQLVRNAIEGRHASCELEVGVAAAGRRRLEIVASTWRDGEEDAALLIARDTGGASRVATPRGSDAERLLLASRAANVGWWDWDIRGEVVSYSPEWKRQLGYAEHEIGTSYEEWESRLHPDDRAPTVHTLHAVLDGRERDYRIEFRMRHKDGSWRWMFSCGQLVIDDRGEPARLIGCHLDITPNRPEEEDRLGHFWFLEGMERLNHAIHGAADLNQMMRDALDAILAIFDCDRAWLVYPCDPQAPSWRVAMERTRDEYPGALELGVDVPMDPGAADVMRALQGSGSAVMFGPGTKRDVPKRIREQFSVKSILARSIRPRSFPAYAFGLHQCSRGRVWTPLETRMFEAIGDRLSEALTILLVHRTLAESESRLREAERMARLGWWSKDYRANTASLSDEARRILGLPLESGEVDLAEFERRWRAAIHHDDRTQVRQAEDHARAALRSYDVEYKLEQADGELRALHCHGDVKDTDGAGRPVGMFGFIQDVTELRRSEDELRASEARFRTFVDHATDAFFLYDERSVILDVNEHACESLGYARDELIGMSMADFDIDSVQNGLVDCTARLGAGETVTIEGRHRRKDGAIFPVEVRIRAFHHDGRLHSVALARDVSERQRMGRALSLFRALVDHANDSIEVVDPATGRILDVNDKACAEHGYSREEYLALRVPEIDPTVGDDERWEQKIAYLREHGSLVHEGLHRRKDGSVFPVEVNVTFVSLDRDYLVAVVRDITERKQSEEKLRQNREQLDAIIRSVDGIFWEADAETFQFDFVSPSAERLLGYPPQCWIDEPRFWVDHLHPEDRAAAVQYCAECTARQQDHELEYRMLAADGRIVWMRDLVSVVVEGDRPVKLRGMMLDVTAHKQAETRIRRLNRTYAVLTDINQLMVRERDPTSVMEQACRIAVETGGFLLSWIGLFQPQLGRQEVVSYAGATEETLDVIRALLHDPERGCAFTARALQHGCHAVCNDVANHPLAAPWRQAALDRGYRSLASFPLTSSGRTVGTITFYAGEADFFDADEVRLLDELSVDISFALDHGERARQRREALDQLRVSEERFRSLAETISDVFWVSNVGRTRLLYVSPAYETIWGRSLQSLADHPSSWLEAVHEEDRDRVAEFVQATPTSGVHAEEYRVVRPDGTVRWIRDQAFPVRGVNGEDERVVAVARDITDHRQLEEQFRQAQKMEAIGQLAGGVAHDFNNMLAVMMMQVDLAETVDAVPEEVREGLREIRVATERAASLTRQLLLFSRRQVIQAHDLDLNEIVTNLARMLQRIIGEDVQLQLHLSPSPLMLRVDPGMIDQLLLNLAVNARDAMPGGGRLVVETGEAVIDEETAQRRPDAKPGPHACLRVTDTGQGIPADVLPRIFEPFFTTKERGKGTGLGLATVFGIVRQHHGWIRVNSELGRGACFEVFLPFAGEVTSPGGARPPERLERVGGSETILLVEDEQAVRRLVRAVLERSGYTVIEAVDGKEALALWSDEQHRIDLLLTDLVMPSGVSGHELVRRLHEHNSRLKVVFISGYSAEIAGQEISLREGENFLEKPFVPRQLLKVVRRSLDA